MTDTFQAAVQAARNPGRTHCKHNPRVNHRIPLNSSGSMADYTNGNVDHISDLSAQFSPYVTRVSKRGPSGKTADPAQSAKPPLQQEEEARDSQAEGYCTLHSSHDQGVNWFSHPPGTFTEEEFALRDAGYGFTRDPHDYAHY